MSLLKMLMPPMRPLLLLLLLTVAASGLVLINPYLAGRLTQTLLSAPGEALPSQVTLLLLAWFVLLVMRAAVAFFTDYLVGMTGESTLTRLRLRLHEHMLVMPMSYFQDSKPGHQTSLLDNDADEVGWFVSSTLPAAFGSMITLVGALTMIALLDLQLALLVMILMPAYYVMVKLLGRTIRPLSAQWYEKYADMLATYQENLGLVSLIRSFTRENVEAARFKSQNDQLLEISRQSYRAESALGPFGSLVAGAGVLLLIWLGSLRVAEGALVVSELVSLIFCAWLVSSPLVSLAGLYGQWQSMRAAANRLDEFFSIAPEPAGLGLPDIGPLSGSVTLDAVSFRYPTREPVLQDMSMQLMPGETVAIVGENGAGKSTLVHLLLRFADPTAGRILLDGKDIRDHNLESIRRQIGLVSQQTLLLDGTVAENIAYASTDGDQDAIVSAAELAQADSFIRQLPAGYDTLIGDQGIKLSGGQRQRLALARAIYKDPPVLILDEATSMFDPEAEASFLRMCHDLFQDRTVIMITHKTPALTLADRVLRLESGRLYPALQDVSRRQQVKQ